ncbi:MAG: hypothetical protein AB8B57_12265 [Congregibacter sp.]
MINRENGKQQLIATQVVEALKTCTAFDTVKAHVQRICSGNPALSGQAASVQQTLEQLKQAGFLLEASTVCLRLNQTVETPLSSTRVCVITCDRPAALERLLESMLRAGGLSKHDALYLIDDSRLQENQTANAELIETFNIRSAKPMQYIGRDVQNRLMGQLISQLPDHENGIRFLLDAQRWKDKPTYGRSRTLCLLLSVGYRTIMLDDDILCQAVQPAVPEEGVFVGSEGRREASFFADVDSLMSYATPLEKSPLDLHTSVLGTSVSWAAQSLNNGPLQEAQLLGANAAMANIWKPNSPVLVSQCGSWGDPGTGDAHWTINLSEHSVSRLLSANGGIVSAIESRCAWLGTPRPTIMKMAFMSQMTGVDNSALLPPYFPAFRGEDLLFAAMVEAMHPLGCIVELAFAVPHLPEHRERKTLRGPIANAGGIGLFAAYLTNQIDYTDGNDPAQRLSIVVQDLRRMAKKSTNNLLLDYRREVATTHAAQLHTLRSQLEATRDFDSGNWQGYLERAIVETEQALQRSWSPTDIDEISGDSSEEQIVQSFKLMLCDFADGLEGWESIRSAASHFSAQLTG